MSHNLVAMLDERLADGDCPPLEGFKHCIRAGAEDLARRFHAGERVEQLVRDRADFIDAVLCRAWDLFLPAGSEAALIAVGGYGRGELHPASDVDVLILTGPDPEVLASPIERFVILLWDMGLEIGHSVRSVPQCVAEAQGDVTVITNLLETRHIRGDAALYEELCVAVGPDQIWPSDAYFSAKLTEQEGRHRKFDDTAYNLEPNIKENPGGLRDIQIIGWVAKRHFGARTMQDLVGHGFLTEHEYRDLMAGQTHLWQIRFALHLLTRRHEDRLLFDYQRALATELGYQDDRNNLAVEQFMQDYYRTVMRLNRLNEMLLQLFREAIVLKNDLGPPLPINRRFQARNGYVEVVDNGIFARKPLAMLEIFLVLQQHPELHGVRASTIRLIRAHRHLIDDRFRQDIKARSLFMEILRQPTGITKALQRMNRYGILARYIPAFGNIVGRMQYDLFHVYTVDEHTLRLIRNLRRFSVPQLTNEFPLCSRTFECLPKPHLLYLAGLFHDIAKGRGGDHSLLGARDAWDFCKLHELSDYDARLVTWLVEKHLLMSMTAQRKDIEDPEVVQAFAAEVGDFNRLSYLYLLTVADMRATNPKRWNSWKNSLLSQLYTSARNTLARGLDRPQDQDILVAQKQTEARALLARQGHVGDAVTDLWRSLTFDYFLQSTPEEIAWQTGLVLDSGDDLSQPLVEIRSAPRGGATEIFLCVNDRDNLFAHSTALLDQLALTVQAARIQTADHGCAMNTFFVLEEDGSLVSSPAREEEIIMTLRVGLSEPDSFDAAVTRRVPRQLKHFDIPVEILFDQDETNQRTELRLRSCDRPGLLCRVGQAFAEHGVRLNNARIATLGAVAEDTFHLTDHENRPITDPDQLAELAKSIRERLTA